MESISVYMKIILPILFFLLIGSCLFLFYKNNELNKKQLEFEQQIILQKDLLNNVNRAFSQYLSKDDFEKAIKETNIDLNLIKDDLKKLNGSLSSLNKITVISNGQNSTNIPSTEAIPNNSDNEKDTFGYLKNKQILNLNENFPNQPVPFGKVEFDAARQNPWSLNVYPREYNVLTILGTDENQRIYSYNQFNIKINDKTYDLKINNSNIKQIFPEPQFSFFNPRLYLTTGGSINFSNLPILASANIGATVSLMSYGIYKTNPDFSILQLGAGYQTQTERLSFIFNPVNLNFKSIIENKLITNTYIGPSMQIDTKGNIFTGFNLSTGF